MNERACTVAIVVNWNGWPWTERCLTDLAASRPPLDVLVVDNGSSDGSADRLRERAGPRIDTILLSANRGFAAALNVALDRVTARGYRFVWLLNNDLRIPPDCHERLLVGASREATPTVWTPDLLSPSGEPQHVGGVWACDGSSARLIASRDMASVPPEGLWLTGTALFCAMSTASLIGPFDESFFAYWEDADWSFRARRAGVELRAAADAKVTHLGSLAAGGRGSPLSTFLIARNELLFLRKHVPRARRRAALLRVVARQLRWAMLLERRGLAGMAGNVLGGVLAGIAGRRGRPRLTSVPRPCVRVALRRPLAIARHLEIAADRLSVRGS